MDYELPRPSGYTLVQIVLHWVIAALVTFQLLFGEAIEEAAEALREGEAIGADEAFAADLHVWAGITILALAIVRLVIRLGHGAPPAPEGTNRLQVLAANVVHWAFYALLIGVPVSGLVAWFVTPAAGEFHTMAKPAFVVLILLHLVGVVFHQFFGKDPVMQRMLAPSK